MSAHPALTVLLLPGVVTRPARLRGWQRTLEQGLRGVQVRLPPRCWYWPWGARAQGAMVDWLCTALEHAGPTWLLAHSFGGLIARAALARAPHAEVRLLTTMASPHAYPWFGIAGRSRALGTADAPEVPTLSYGGWFDWTVPYVWTALPGAYHTNLPCGHLAFLYAPGVRARVLRDACAVFAGAAGEVLQPPETV